jgi:chemotaxis protein MotA
VLRANATIKTVLFPEYSNALGRLRRLIDLSQQARAEGHLSLQDVSLSEPDPFLRKCIELIADGVDAKEVKEVLELELDLIGDRHSKGAEIFQTMGSVAPAIGLLGTLIGLIQMLQHMDDASSIGPSMAIALLTTFYGALIANLFCLPLAGKLRSRSSEETLLKEMTIEGTICIIEQKHPRVIESRLLCFLPTRDRRSEFS